MDRREGRVPRVLRAVVGGDPGAYRDSLLALLVGAMASLVAGITLATSDTVEELPGLLLLVPAALAIKGNIFGALGSRLGTSIHAGSFRLTFRLDSVVGQNTAAALVLTLLLSVVLAVMAKGVAIVFSVSPTMSVADFVVVSTVGGVIASVVVLAITLVLANASVRYDLDLDNVVAPLVTATGDVISLPALVWAAELASVGGVTPAVAWTVTALSVVAVIWAVRPVRDLLRTVVLESIPVLVVAGLLDLIAGITIERRLDDFLEYPVLLILFPGFLGLAGSLGGVLSSRLATKLHLGLLPPGPFPTAAAGRDIAMVFALSVPVFLVVGAFSEMGAHFTGDASPGFGVVLAATMLGGMFVTGCVVVVAYYSTIVAVRFGLDPDTYGIPVVSSSLDFIGAFALILAIVAVGIA